MKRTSLRLGTRRMVQGSLVSSVAAMMGSTAFFAPLISTSPCKGTPPLINKLSMSDNNSRSLSVVLKDGFDNPVLRIKNFANELRLAVTEFEHDFAAGF